MTSDRMAFRGLDADQELGVVSHETVQSQAVSRPLLLDLFCCAGGCSMGYYRAGFDVVGVDIDPQPNYPLMFMQGDALEVLGRLNLSAFAAISASPPCQHYANVTNWRGQQDDHPDLVDATREALNATGLPWVMENVPEAPVRPDYLLCGSMFGLPIRRHRAFETNWSGIAMSTPCQHRGTDLPFMHKGERAFADAMGCMWMSNREGRQAIPPSYTEHIGRDLRAHLASQAMAA